MTRRERRGGRRVLQTDMIVAASAVLVGVCALGVSVYQAQIMRAQQRASVWPHVELFYSYPGDGTLRFAIENNGLGPARIETFEIFIDDERVRDWDAAGGRLFSPEMMQQRPGLTTSYVRGRVLPPERTLTIAEIRSTTFADTLRRHIDRVGLRVCYCSVYDECWQAAMHLPETRGAAVAGCTVAAE